LGDVSRGCGRRVSHDLCGEVEDDVVGFADYLRYPYEIADVYVEVRLLFHLAPQRVGKVLAVLDAAPGYRPQAARRFLRPLHHQQSAVVDDDCSDRYLGAVHRHSFLPSSLPINYVAVAGPDGSYETAWLRHSRGELALDRCLVMGIENRTPDSFYDGGRINLEASVNHAGVLVEEGADIVDVGGVKAGPGAPVSVEEEERRVLPLVAALAERSPVPLSIETGRAQVARAAIAAGAAIVNDITGLSDPRMADVCAEEGAALILTHHGGQIRGRPRHPRYEDIVEAVLEAWDAMVAQALRAGVSGDRIVLDPGLDFGKTTFHSLELLRRVDELTASGYPILIAPSHKDVIGETLGLSIDDRLEGTLATVALSVVAGAAAVRVHDVGKAVRTVRMVEAVMGRRSPVRPLRGLWD
jgi:dihydropteroate synthase